MIPKVVHYIWFSNEPYPPLVQKCIESWHKHLPDYEIKLWNCDNFDVRMNTWCSQAYDAGKYAFVADFARLWILYNYGGIYLDSDVEIRRNFDDLLSNQAFLGFFAKPGSVEAETIGSEPKQEMIWKLLNYYDKREFVMADGEYDLKILPEIIYDILRSEGMNEDKVEQYVGNVHIYPPGHFLMSDDLFYLDYNDGIAYLNGAYSLHYGAGGWHIPDNWLYNFFKRNYLRYFWTIYRIIRNPVLFRVWKIGINTYRKYFWG